MDDKQISPEEKLLKVIQGGNAKQDNPSADGAAVKAAAGPMIPKPAATSSAPAQAAPKPAQPKPAQTPAPSAAKAEPAPAKPAQPVAVPKPAAAAQAPAPAQPAGKEQLKLKQTAPAAGKAPASGAQAKLEAEAKQEPSGKSKASAPAPAAAPSIKKTSEGSSLFQRINWVLAAVILVALCLSGWEIFAGMATFSSIKMPAPVQSGGIDLPAQSEEEIYNIKLITEAYKIRPIYPPDLTKPDAVTDPAAGGTTVIVPPAPPWQNYAKENIKLMGFAGPDPKTAEAILSDVKLKSMHFVAVGSKINIQGNEISIAEVQKDFVLLSDGKGKPLEVR